MIGRDKWNERRIAAGLLLVGFLLIFPAVVIGGPGFGATSAWSRRLPFLFDPVWEKYWSIAFAVVTLYGLVILEGVLRRHGDHIFARLGKVTFALATAMWLVLVNLDLNGVRGGRDFESFFVILAFPALLMYGLAILRTRVLPKWVGAAVALWSGLLLIRVFPHSEGPLFYEPAIILIALALLFTKESPPAVSAQGSAK